MIDQMITYKGKRTGLSDKPTDKYHHTLQFLSAVFSIFKDIYYVSQPVTLQLDLLSLQQQASAFSKEVMKSNCAPISEHQTASNKVSVASGLMRHWCIRLLKSNKILHHRVTFSTCSDQFLQMKVVFCKT